MNSNRTAIRDLEPGDRFAHSHYGHIEFLGWVNPTSDLMNRGAWIREAFDGMRNRCVPLNMAGSVILLDN